MNNSTTNPINKAIQAVAEIFDVNKAFKSYLVTSTGLTQLVETLKHLKQENSDSIPILLKLGNKKEKNYQYYYSILSTLIKERKLGISAEINSFVIDLVSQWKITDQDNKQKQKEFKLKILEDLQKSNTGIIPSDEIKDKDQQDETKELFFAWAKLESQLTYFKPNLTLFMGGVKPIVYVFDDYINYIKIDKIDNNKIYSPKKDESHISKFYGCDSTIFTKILQGFCGHLNHLSLTFDVRTYPLWIPDSQPNYELVYNNLPFAQIEKERSQIAAFIVDLEWQPTLIKPTSPFDSNKKWSKMGYRAIHILAQKYPEIPSFIFTGLQNVDDLQEALSHGASWGFYKSKSHHLNPPNQIGEPLTALTLEQYLRRATNARYECYQEIPNPQQLEIEPSQPEALKLINKLGLKLPLESTPQGQVLKRMIAELLPNAHQVEPVKILTSGKSGAQATFFVSPIFENCKLATRFIKIASWLSIQKEYFAYQQIILPRLNSYTSSIVQKPVLAQGDYYQLPKGAIMYSSAGFPEDYHSLVSLDDLLKKQLESSSKITFLYSQIQNTLANVLAPLYQLPKIKKIRQRPLCQWFWDILPPLSGVLIPLSKVTAPQSPEKSPEVLLSYIAKGYKEKTAWLLASFQLNQVLNSANGNPISPWDEKFGNSVLLSGWLLQEIECSEGAWEEGQITLSHPDLGLRIRLRGTAKDICQRFSASWIRPRMPVEVWVCLDKNSTEIEKLKKSLLKSVLSTNFIEDNTYNINNKLLNKFERITNNLLPNPFNVFGHNIDKNDLKLPYSYTITAHQGAIHGDLNLNNILYASETETIGWLIDFERVQPKGMIAYDLAKLEVEIWNHHLSPHLSKVANICLLHAQTEKNQAHYLLIYTALEALDFTEDSAEFFSIQVKNYPQFATVSDTFLLSICRLLNTIKIIRNFAFKTCKLDPSELQWALAVYFFNGLKFKDIQPHSVIYAFIASAWYLKAVLPASEANPDKMFNLIKSGISNQKLQQQVDKLLIQIHQDKITRFNKFTVKMAESDKAKEVNELWNEKAKNIQRWDLASTGGVANITPILGYLWLMAAAEKTKDGNKYTTVVPKISSEGSSCGTVDILAAGGFTFTSNPMIIIQECLESGGIICQQDKELTPIDKNLMRRRTQINLMKDISLTCASILAKKIAMGCTHAIIDVKLGKDAKILSPWIEQEQGEILQLLLNPEQENNLVIQEEKILNIFKSILEKVGMNRLKLEKNWIKQDCSNSKMGSLKKVYWVLTNADIPQCRAIGRQLILLHLDQVISESDDLFEQPYYKKLYKEIIPEIYNSEDRVSEDKTIAWETVKEEWNKLKLRLPKLEKIKSVFHDYLYNSNLKLEHSHSLRDEEKKEIPDLKAISFGLYPYHLEAWEKTVTIKGMNAVALDILFDWLSGDNNRDPEVGIWLHKLPGEKVCKVKNSDGENKPESSNPSTLKNTNIQQQPLISVFYRPSRCEEKEVITKIREFICTIVIS